MSDLMSNEPKNDKVIRTKTTLKHNISHSSMSMNEIVSLAWGVKEDLRGEFKKTEWGKIILPFILLRRLGSALAPSKDNVISEYEKIKGEKPEYVEARLNKISGYEFHNHSKFDLEKIHGESEKLVEKNMLSYIRGFSPNIQEILEKFDFSKSLKKLHKEDLLFDIVGTFASSKLDFDPKKIDNHMMGTIYEEVIRRANEETNEDAGEYFTPREVIRLMVNLLFVHEKEKLEKKGKVHTIYDPASGTGGMLSIASEYIERINDEAIIDTYGQELNDETYAVCKSDMLIKDLDLDRIKQGNSLIFGNKGDGFYDSKFEYMLSNPPFGQDWKKYATGVSLESEKGFEGKYGPGIPRKSDGSLLFLMHMISKMKPKEEGGSRIAIVLNGSPLFTGDAGSGESDIRKWIIKKDMLETIVALPNDMFYNTGISTYIWIVTNNKDEKRKGKIQLIDASGDKFYKKLTSSLGKKRNFIDDGESGDDQIQQITDIFESFTEGEFSKIFDNDDFAYTRITVERPLRRSFEISKDNLDELVKANSFAKFDEYKEKPKQPKAKDVIKVLSKMSTKTYKSFEEFSFDIKEAFTEADYKLDANKQKTLAAIIAKKDENAETEKDSKGNIVADSGLRDYENIPKKDDVDKYFAKEVLPHVPDAWINETSYKIGYEILFTKYFYVYKPPRSLEEIDKDLKENQKEISNLQNEVIGK
jgi:type I restriction enzyme M protein